MTMTETGDAISSTARRAPPARCRRAATGSVSDICLSGEASNAFLRMFSLGLAQRCLGSGDGLLLAFAHRLSSRLFPVPFAIPAVLLPFEGDTAFRSAALSTGRADVFFGLAP